WCRSPSRNSIPTALRRGRACAPPRTICASARKTSPRASRTPETRDMALALKRVRSSVLDIAYEESGSPDGTAVFLMHGFPYDPRTYDEVAPRLAAAGCRVIVPYLRGYGATRFLSADTPRSGARAALGNDLRELMDGLGVERAVLAGYDWGGRAACVVAALWPQRVSGLVSANGYNIHDVAASAKPAPPKQEQRLWYQYYFHTERGRAGL